MDIGGWLRSLGLEEYEVACRDQRGSHRASGDARLLAKPHASLDGAGDSRRRHRIWSWTWLSPGEAAFSTAVSPHCARRRAAKSDGSFTNGINHFSVASFVLGLDARAHLLGLQVSRASSVVGRNGAGPGPYRLRVS